MPSGRIIRPMLSPHAADLLRSPIGLELFYLIEWRQETSLSDDEIDSRAREARSSATIYRGDYDDHRRVLRTLARRYEGPAEWVVSRMARWWKPIDRGAQVWVHGTHRPPSRQEFVTDLSQFGPEAPKPKRALWTCTSLPGLMSPWLESGENLHRSEPHRLWKLGVPD